MVARIGSAMFCAILAGCGGRSFSPSAVSALPSRHLGRPRPPQAHRERDALVIRGGAIAAATTAAASATATATDSVSASAGALTHRMGPLIDSTIEALLSGQGARGVAALSAVCSATVIPLSLARQTYAFAVGPGAAMVACSLVLAEAFGVSPVFLSTFAPRRSLSATKVAGTAHALLVQGCLLHGARLAGMSMLRDAAALAWRTADGSLAFPRIRVLFILRRIPLAITISVLCAVMISPLLYVLRAAVEGGRADTAVASFALRSGVVVTYSGLVLAAAADMHGFLAEQFRHGKDLLADQGDAGAPGGGGSAFRLAQHASYVGEGMFWSGLIVAGTGTFGRDTTAWLCAMLGMVGIIGGLFLPYMVHLVLRQIEPPADDR